MNNEIDREKRIEEEGERLNPTDPWDDTWNEPILTCDYNWNTVTEITLWNSVEYWNEENCESKTFTCIDWDLNLESAYSFSTCQIWEASICSAEYDENWFNFIWTTEDLGTQTLTKIVEREFAGIKVWEREYTRVITCNDWDYDPTNDTEWTITYFWYNMYGAPWIRSCCLYV